MSFAPVAMSLAALSILYCAKVAFAQSDIKRLIAYTSVSHMGFVTLGVYAWNEQALQCSDDNAGTRLKCSGLVYAGRRFAAPNTYKKYVRYGRLVVAGS